MGHTSCSLEGTLYEEAIRIPFIVRYPRALPRAKLIETQVSQFDIMPTIMALVGLPMPKETEGRSLVPLACGEKVPFVEETYATTLPCGWQVLKDDPRKIWCLRTPQWKLLYYEYAPRENNRCELFDLREDPGEKTNVYDQNPKVAEELKRKLSAWMNHKPSRFIGPSD